MLIGLQTFHRPRLERRPATLHTPTMGIPKPAPLLGRRTFLHQLAGAATSGCLCQDGPTSSPTSAAIPPYARRIDVHVHCSPSALDRLVAIMDAEGIARAVNLSGGHSRGILEEQLRLSRAHNERVVVYTSPPWAETLRPDYGPRLAKALREAADLGARGLKISKGLGLGVRGPHGELLRIDEPQLDELFETAGQLKLPVMIHSGDPIAFWRPVGHANERHAELEAHPGWSLYGKPVPSFDELYAQLEARIARHPGTTFVSVHFGNCAEQPERVAQSLRRHPHLIIDTAARIPEIGRHPVATMRAFFEEFQDRILFGSDLGVGPHPSPLFLGSSGSQPPTQEQQRLFFEATRRYFESDAQNIPHPTPIQGDWLIDGLGLPSSLLEKLYVTNAQRSLGL